MKTKRVVLVVVALAVITVGCEQLASLQNSNVRISGEWQKIEMSFPGDDVYDFSERVIRLNGFEEGTYRFESNSELEVTLRGQSSVYEIEFVGDSKMIWYRRTPKGRDRISEWVRAE
ncbi:MAG: hypothetical protein DRJ65_08275 [Acidobacteria bacterium]|nr:MAG: hypothetical protein DRJ65_08275 [Acidobacteriota bacterium]